MPTSETRLFSSVKPKFSLHNVYVEISLAHETFHNSLSFSYLEDANYEQQSEDKVEQEEQRQKEVEHD